MNTTTSSAGTVKPGPTVRFLLFAGFIVTLAGQTTVYLPAVGAPSCQVITASSATPSVITCASHGFSSGNVIAIFSGQGTQTAGWVVNGLRKVGTVVDANDFTITDINGTNIAGPSSFVCPSQTGVPNIASRPGCRAVLLTAYTTKAHPRVFGLDGSGGTLTSDLQTTGSTGWANTNNPAWQALQAVETNFINGNPPANNVYTDYTADPVNTMAWGALAALDWWANSGSTQLAMAKEAVVTNPLDFIRGSAGCAPAATSYAFCGYRTFDSDYSSFYSADVLLAYSLIRSQLTTGQRATFAAQFLNDNVHSTDGIDTTACTPQPYTLQGTATISGTGNASTGYTAIVGVGTNFTSYNPGDVIFLDPAGYQSNNAGNVSGRIVSITDDTHLTLSLYYSSISSTTFYYSPAWTTGNCGVVWFEKHHQQSPLSDPTNYGYNGGLDYNGYSNLTMTKLFGFIEAGLALADDDPRAVELLAVSSAFFYDQNLYLYKQTWTGFASTTPGYYWTGRWLTYCSDIALSLKNGISGGPDYTQGTWLSSAMSQQYMLTYPGQAETWYTYGEGGDSTSDLIASMSFSTLPWMYSSLPEAGYLNYWFRNSAFKNGWTSSSLQGVAGWPLLYHYIFGAPTATQTALSGAPLQRVYKDTDQAQCPTFGYSCTSTPGYGYMISRTGLSSSGDDFIMFATPDNISPDHGTGMVSGALRIYRNGILLGGDNTNGSAGACCGPQNGVTDEAPELAGQSNFVTWGATYGSATITNWASTDPTGDSSNRYAYLRSNLAGQYTSGVMRAYRSIAHLKKPGYQDYIVQYDDFALSSPSTIKTYLHFFAYPSALPGGVTYTSGTNSVTNLHSNALLNTTVLFPASNGTTEVDNANGSYTGGTGDTFRVTVCAGSSGTCSGSATTGEWLIVHEPINGTAGRMPALTQPTVTAAGGSAAAVQIADSSYPRIAVFARQGALLSALNFTTTHSGTAQYLIAGLAPGTYTVTVGGNTVVNGATVNSGDNTLYFESASGAVVVTGVAAPGSGPSCDLNGDGAVNVLDVSIEIAVALGINSCTPKYDINDDGLCNVIDVERVVNAAIGGQCVAGP